MWSSETMATKRGFAVWAHQTYVFHPGTLVPDCQKTAYPQPNVYTYPHPSWVILHINGYYFAWFIYCTSICWLLFLSLNSLLWYVSIKNKTQFRNWGLTIKHSKHWYDRSVCYISKMPLVCKCNNHYQYTQHNRAHIWKLKVFEGESKNCNMLIFNLSCISPKPSHVQTGSYQVWWRLHLQIWSLCF